MHVFEQFLDLVGHEHRGWFVQEQNLCTLVQRFDDFDALTLADREIAHGGARIDRQTIGLGNFGDAIVDRLAVEAEVEIATSQNDVFRHGEAIDESEVLVHHRDPVVQARSW